MKILKTEKQQVLGMKPTKLEMLQEIDKRGGLKHHKKFKDELYRLEKGLEGEERLIDYLKTFGLPNWVGIRNLWLEHFGEFECDLLLLTQAGPVAFEVKNYLGALELQNNQCFINGKIIGHNPFSQAQKVVANVQEILQTPTVQGVLAFTGEHNSVQLHDPIAGLNVLMLNQLQHFIRQLAAFDRTPQNRPIPTATYLQTLDHFEIGKPSKEQDLPGEMKTGVRGGIHCCHCNHFNLKRDKNYLICRCGMYEPYEEAIVRTICEYGVIYPERELTTKALTDFFGGEVSESTVFRHLTKHFKRVGKRKSAHYINTKIVLDKNRAAFDLSQPKYMRIS